MSPFKCGHFIIKLGKQKSHSTVKSGLSGAETDGVGWLDFNLVNMSSGETELLLCRTRTTWKHIYMSNLAFNEHKCYFLTFFPQCKHVVWLKGLLLDYNIKVRVFQLVAGGEGGGKRSAILCLSPLSTLRARLLANNKDRLTAESNATHHWHTDINVTDWHYALVIVECTSSTLPHYSTARGKQPPQTQRFLPPPLCGLDCDFERPSVPQSPRLTEGLRWLWGGDADRRCLWHLITVFASLRFALSPDPKSTDGTVCSRVTEYSHEA